MSASQTFSPDLIAGQRDDLAAVRAWLWIVAGLVFCMVLVGGATRLTESGLSITEWKPMLGAIPPLSDAAWQAEFDKYKQIPQYSQLFPNMTLAEFKTIFYWEWGHRQLGRLIGVVYALPLFYFALRGRVRGGLLARLFGVLLLGGAQGAVGWWMVASGLVDRVEVAPERLATHLLLASLTFMALIWIALGLRRGPQPGSQLQVSPQIARLATIFMWLVLLQIVMGALVAGSRAGLSYNSWPLMDGRFIPPADHLLRLQPWWLNSLENVTTIQFQHRMTAYLVVAFALWQAFTCRRAAETPGGAQAARRSLILAGWTLAQAGLGIATLLLAAGKIPLHAALAHQAVAFILLGLAVAHARRSR